MKYYKIEEQELLSLLSDSRVLTGLQAAGVDNWEGNDIVGECLEDYPETVAEDLPSLYEVIN